MFTIGNEKIALVTDTSCDLLDEQLQAYDIRLISLRLNTSRGEFRDRVEITPDEVVEMLRTEVPKTSLPLPEDVSALYQQLKEEGCTTVLHLSISSGLSGTYNMVTLLAQEFPEMKIHVVDTKTLSAGLGMLVMEAGECLKLGMPVEDVIHRLQGIRRHQLGTFVIRTLEFLRKGGRIGLVEGVLGTLLQLKPVIFVNDDGIYQTLSKARGFQNALSVMCTEIANRFKDQQVRLAVVHASALEEAQHLLERLKEQLTVVSSYITPVSPALTIHTGPGLLGAIVTPVREPKMTIPLDDGIVHVTEG